MGGRGSNGSGDIFLSFSTANPGAFDREETAQVSTLANDQMTPFFEATVQAVEEAIMKVLVAAETLSGINGNKVSALPHELLTKVLKDYNRLAK